MNKKLLIAIVVLVAIGALGWYLQRQEIKPPSTPVTEVPQPLPAPQPIIRDEPTAESAADAEQAEPVQLPLLAESDAEVRAEAAELAPRLAAWLTPEEQVRKWTVLVDLAADGVVMEKNRPLGFPMSAYKVTGEEGNYRPDAANYGRTDELVATLTAIPPARAAAIYKVWQPLFEEAYGELGKPGSFDQRLKLAIDRIVAVKPLNGTPTLVRPKVFYRYADPKLEKSSEVEKLMWRLGPDNSAKLQAWLTEVRAAL